MELAVTQRAGHGNRVILAERTFNILFGMDRADEQFALPLLLPRALQARYDSTKQVIYIKAMSDCVTLENQPRNSICM
jgi:hypothetical protein